MLGTSQHDKCRPSSQHREWMWMVWRTSGANFAIFLALRPCSSWGFIVFCYCSPNLVCKMNMWEIHFHNTIGYGVWYAYMATIIFKFRSIYGDTLGASTRSNAPQFCNTCAIYEIVLDWTVHKVLCQSRHVGVSLWQPGHPTLGRVVCDDAFWFVILCKSLLADQNATVCRQCWLFPYSPRKCMF